VNAFGRCVALWKVIVHDERMASWQL
jgi:hypothetical protein